jgi:predicted DNA-binding transcriptional regulator AlpA
MVISEITMAQFIEQNNARLEKIEQSLLSQKTVLNMTDFCSYVGISKSWAYKLTSQRAVPHCSPNGKTIYFDRLEVDKWLLQNPIKTASQLKLEVKR